MRSKALQRTPALLLTLDPSLDQVDSPSVMGTVHALVALEPCHDAPFA